MTGEHSPLPDELQGAAFSNCRLLRKLGQGGMGSVYLARREPGGDEVVVKLLNPAQCLDAEWRGRFIREAELLQDIAHPNLVRIDFVEPEGERPHIVMEYVAGDNLEQVLAARGPIPPTKAAVWARAVCSALEATHERSVIHRDIKPANILLDGDGQIKLVDFGLAKNIQADDGLSMAGQVLGTPNYMAPEQWGDHEVDARGDLFSLGVTLYQLVTGRLPFVGENREEVAQKILHEPYTPPGEIIAGIPEDLGFILARLLEKDRHFRYGSARDCGAHLDLLLAGEPVPIPCLVELRDGQRGARHPLIPGERFRLGRETNNDVVLFEPSISRHHAEIARGRGGYVLRDLGSSYGAFLDNMRVREVALKDGDRLRLGRLHFEFRDGGVGRALSRSSRALTQQALLAEAPLPILESLARRSDKRVVVALLERLAPDFIEGPEKDLWTRLAPVIGHESAAVVSRKLDGRLKRLRDRAISQLFAITRENLGDDTDGWLSWWGGARDRYPIQLVPPIPEPGLRLMLIEGARGPSSFATGDKAALRIGREDDCDIQLASLSVSREHASLIRLGGRWIIHDTASRFGTRVNGHSVQNAFLSAGDAIRLGRVQLEVAFEPPPPIADALLIEPETFDILLELNHPSALAGALSLLQRPLDDEAIAALLAVTLSDEALIEAMTRGALKAYDKSRKKAEATVHRHLGRDPQAWGAAYRALDERPPQVLPAGWGLEQRLA